MSTQPRRRLAGSFPLPVEIKAILRQTATQLVQAIIPSANFRVINDHYIGQNGVAHVNFRQTLHGIDIDNADFNVNVGFIQPFLPYMCNTDILGRSERMEMSSPTDIHSTPTMLLNPTLSSDENSLTQ